MLLGPWFPVASGDRDPGEVAAPRLRHEGRVSPSLGSSLLPLAPASQIPSSHTQLVAKVRLKPHPCPWPGPGAPRQGGHGRRTQAEGWAGAGQGPRVLRCPWEAQPRGWGELTMGLLPKRLKGRTPPPQGTRDWLFHGGASGTAPVLSESSMSPGSPAPTARSPLNGAHYCCGLRGHALAPCASRDGGRCALSPG